MPPMGESIFECTVLKWLVNEGDKISEDDMIIEVATDKIDTEIGSSYNGVIEKFLVQEGDTAIIGNPICLIRLEGVNTEKNSVEIIPEVEKVAEDLEAKFETIKKETSESDLPKSSKFYSPLVLNIAKEENISIEKLDQIEGTGKEGRVTKNDIFNYLAALEANKEITTKIEIPTVSYVKSLYDEVIPMDRMRKVISERMVTSKRISAHVTSYVEVDMTDIVQWRNKIKDDFFKNKGEKITFTPLLIDAVVRAIQRFPLINIQVEDEYIIKKKDINVGMAVALENGNLIVPVIKNADSYNLIGLAKKVNDLAQRARKNQLKADELTEGTYTVSNIGTFDNLFGTPIILQPQVAIMAFGSIKKVPAILETPSGDVIAIRHKMIISHSYDHRVVDGSLGGMFAKQVAENLEKSDFQRITF